MTFKICNIVGHWTLKIGHSEYIIYLGIGDWIFTICNIVGHWRLKIGHSKHVHIVGHWRLDIQNGEMSVRFVAINKNTD